MDVGEPTMADPEPGTSAVLDDERDESAEPEHHRDAPLWRKVLGIVISLAVVGAVFGFVLPSIADYGEVLDTIQAMTWLEVTTLALAALWNLASYQPPLMASLPGLNFTHAGLVSQASTAIANTVPAGAAFGIGLTARMYRSFGFKRRPIALSILVAGLWNVFLKLALPVVAVTLLVFSGPARTGLVVAAAVGVAALVLALAVFWQILRSEAGARRVGDWCTARWNWVRRRFGKQPVASFARSLVKFRVETIDLLRTNWVALTLWTFVSQHTLYVVLLMSMRHVGIPNEEVSWQEVLAAFSFVRLLSALPITPGGVGVVELGLTGALVAAGGLHAPVVAAVLVYRALTFLPPIFVGAGCYLYWRARMEIAPAPEPSPAT
jgi:uncharacterized protein (TIRG00374 family)